MELTRRDFVAAAAVTVCGCVIGCRPDRAGEPPADATDPSDLPPENNPQGRVDVGTAADYPHDGVYDRYARSDRVYVVRRGGRICTRCGRCARTARASWCRTRAPCAALATAAGSSLTAPSPKAPPRRPLPHYAITRTDAGRLIVDKSRRFGPDANDPAAYASVT